jgi:D-xylulose reductase
VTILRDESSKIADSTSGYQIITQNYRESNISFVLSAPNKVSFEPRPYPQISDPHDVLIQVQSTGICGSDLHCYRHGRVGAIVLTSPMVLGRESAGTVQAVGSAVTTLQAGDLVALEPGVLCRYCRHCRCGSYNLCSKMRFASTPPYDGTLTDVYRLPEDRCHKIPDVVSLEEGALIEPLSAAVHIIVRQGSIQLGNSVIVFGAGPIGLLCCAVAKACGAASIVAIDINASRLAFAATYAASSTFNSSEHNGLNAAEIAQKLLLESYLPASGADLVVEASGAQASIKTGIHASRPGGTFVKGGMGNDDIVSPLRPCVLKSSMLRAVFAMVRTIMRQRFDWLRQDELKFVHSSPNEFFLFRRRMLSSRWQQDVGSRPSFLGLPFRQSRSTSEMGRGSS